MSKPEPPLPLARVVHSTPWITVVERDVEGLRDPFTFVTRPNFAVVLCETSKGIVMIRQWRHAAQRWSWELPQGARDPGESPIDAAVRELREETGWVASSVQILASDLHEAADWATQTFDVVMCRAESRTSVRREASELIDECAVVPWTELREHVAQGSLIDAATLAALAIRMARE